MDIFDLVATLSLDSSNYDSGLADAEGQADSFASKLSSGLGTAAKVGVGAVGAMAAGVTAAGTALVKGTGSVASFGDNIDKASQKMGISAEAYQEWDAILQHSGTSIDAVGRGMMTLSKAAANNKDSFQKLGISEQEVASLSQEELFGRVISGLQGMEEGADRAALASELLGGSARQLGPLLNTSAEDTEAMRQKVHELGGVMSDEAVKASAAYQDSLQDMQTAMDGMKRGLLSNFLPSITSVMNGVTEIFGGNMDEGLDIIETGVSGFLEKMSDALPKAIEKANAILTAIIQAISNNLPNIMAAGVQIITTLLNGIVSNLPALVEGAVKAIAELAKGLGEQLPTLIPVMVDAVMTIVNALIENAPMLIDAALQLMIGLAEGLINAIPVIIEKIPDIISAIIKAIVQAVPKIAKAGVELLSALVKSIPEIITKIGEGVGKILSDIVGMVTNFIPNMIEAGKNLILGLKDGIVNWGKSVVDGVKNVGNDIINGFKWMFGINSPSKVFAEFGKNLDQGMAKGLIDNIGLVEDAVDDLDDAIYDGVDDDGYYNDNAVVTTTTTTSNDDSGMFYPAREDPQDLTIVLELDGIQVGKAVYPYTSRESRRIGTRLAVGGFA